MSFPPRARLRALDYSIFDRGAVENCCCCLPHIIEGKGCLDQGIVFRRLRRRRDEKLSAP